MLHTLLLCSDAEEPFIYALEKRWFTLSYQQSLLPHLPPTGKTELDVQRRRRKVVEEKKKKKSRRRRRNHKKPSNFRQRKKTLQLLLDFSHTSTTRRQDVTKH